MAVQGTNGGPPGGQEPLNLATESCSVFVNGLSLEVCASFTELVHNHTRSTSEQVCIDMIDGGLL
jgi:hypothetical protein